MQPLTRSHSSLNLGMHPQFDMEALLGSFGEYKAARMKSYDRCKAKTHPDGGDYSEAKLLADDGIEMQDPNCRYLKDVLRCTLLLDRHEDLGKAHAALVAKYEPVTTKDRRQELPRDVLQTVWYEGVIVEVQFHFKAVVALKASLTIGAIALAAKCRKRGSASSKL